tara:strand:- start:478 stop:1476 length:999 start_codon:yes stop_codon:yes gene_type:complete
MNKNTKVTTNVTKKPRKPRTKKADMIKKKLEMESQKELHVPKKRGRKPKGGKIIKTEFNIHEPVVEKKMIILHLKCKTEDLQESLLSDITHYSPFIIDKIKPYDNNENNNNFSVLSCNDTESQQTVNKKEKDCYMFEFKNDTEETNNTKEQTNMKKQINQKLKELEHSFNTNKIMKQSACFWCTCSFNSQPIHIPSLFFQNKYDAYGCFCSPECACSHLFNQNIDNNTKYERYQLLNYIYGKIYNYKKDIKPAPNPYYTLDKYYGNLSIQEYRQLLEYDRLILVIDKPLTKIYPEIHEDNNDFETIYENKIHLKKTNKVNKNAVLNKIFNSS